MALSDYRLCDVCGGKAFYDAQLNWEFGKHVPPESFVRGTHHKLDDLGDWAVICRDCAKEYTCVVIRTEEIKE